MVSPPTQPPERPHPHVVGRPFQPASSSTWASPASAALSPPELGTLTGLVQLHLAATDWTGTIPQDLLDKQSANTLSLWTNRRPTPPAVADQEAAVGHAYQYRVPPFSDRDDDSLLLRARQAPATAAPCRAGWPLTR